MKAHTGFTELVIIMVFIIAGTPLLLALMNTLQRSKFNYLDDKTIYKMSDTVEYLPGTNIPINLSPIRLDYGGCQIIAAIQDDYCPESGLLVNWKLTANTPSGERKTTTGGVNSYSPVDHITTVGYDPTHTLTITRGWLTRRINAFSALHNSVSGPMRPNAKDAFYLVWDYEEDCWMITHEFVNVYEVK